MITTPITRCSLYPSQAVQLLQTGRAALMSVPVRPCSTSDSSRGFANSAESSAIRQDDSQTMCAYRILLSQYQKFEVGTVQHGSDTHIVAIASPAGSFSSARGSCAQSFSFALRQLHTLEELLSPLLQMNPAYSRDIRPAAGV